MTGYNLGHLDQEPGRVYLGPIQDDEALVLYAILRAIKATRVLELGGLGGYSARNFHAAGCHVTTAEINPMTPVADDHVVLTIDCAVIAEHVTGRFDMVFFDAHDLRAETTAFDALVETGAIDTSTIIAIHDTGWHTEQLLPSSYETTEGWVHQPNARYLRDYIAWRGCAELFLATFHGLSVLRWIS